MSEEKDKKTKVVDEIIDWIETLLFSFLTVVLVFTFILRTSEVIGISMNPTFTGRDDSIGQTGDRLIYLSAVSDFDNGDIVVVDSSLLDEAIVKRVIATPGQTIDIDFTEGIVYVDGVALDESYTAEPTYLNYDSVQYPLTLKENEYFIMGDNRNRSLDSRYFGPVNKESIAGKVVFRYAPLSEFGVVGNE